jgi:hypothetical protein
MLEESVLERGESVLLEAERSVAGVRYELTRYRQEEVCGNTFAAARRPNRPSSPTDQVNGTPPIEW